MLGTDGLEHATKMAILNANYMAKRLEDHYKILYRGKNGQCAHEFIIDLRPIKEISELAEADVAKRLMTLVSIPQPSCSQYGYNYGRTNESESKDELDRFCDAMLVIRQEIDDVLMAKCVPRIVH